MWLMTPRGFFSVVEHREHPGNVIVRARARKDLQALEELARERLAGLELLYIEDSPQADYPYRVHMAKSEWAALAAEMAREIDYPNFKDAVKEHNPDRASYVYMAVWSALRRIQMEEIDWEVDEVGEEVDDWDPRDLDEGP